MRKRKKEIEKENEILLIIKKERRGEGGEKTRTETGYVFKTLRKSACDKRETKKQREKRKVEKKGQASY